jgi:hypothetical protein
MSKVPSSPPVHTKNLAQQNTDFTAEGSPAPGKVATAAPLTPHEHKNPLLHLPHKAPDSQKHLPKPKGS